MESFLGRRILLVTLDPVPRLMRASPGFFVINKQEREGLARGDAATFKLLADIVCAEDAAEARSIGKPKKLKRSLLASRTGPGVWLSISRAMLERRAR